MVEAQKNNPLHGKKLADILEALVSEYGWEELLSLIHISEPTRRS